MIRLLILVMVVMVSGLGLGQTPPLTYPARTDSCVCGFNNEAHCAVPNPTGCINGATTGQTGSAMSFMYRDTDTVPFAPLAPANTAATDPDFNTYFWLITDTYSGPNRNAQFTMGDSGAALLISRDNTLFLAKTNNGAAFIYQVNPTLIRAKGCGPATPCGVKSQIRTGSVQVNSFVTNLGCTTSCALIFRTATQTLTNGLTVILHGFSVPNTRLNGQTGTISGVDATHFTMTVTGTLGGYTSGGGNATDSSHLMSQAQWTFSRVSGEEHVLLEFAPSGLQMFKDTINTSGDPSIWTLTRAVYVGGTSDNPQPCSVFPVSYNYSWTSTISSADDGSINMGLAGGEDWRSNWTPTVMETFIRPTIGNSGLKGFQAIAVTGPTSGIEPVWNTCTTTCVDGGTTWGNIGTVNGQGTGFDTFSYQPGTGKGCTRVNALIGKIYRGTGNIQLAGNWSTDDDITCARLGATPPCPINDYMKFHEVSQTFDPTYALLSAGGGTACRVPGKCSCADSNSNYKAAWNSATTYAAHDLVFYNTAWYQSKTAHTSVITPDIDTTNWKADDLYCYTYIWEKATTTIRPCIEIGVGGRNSCDGHSEKGWSNIYAGGKLYSHLYSKPTIDGKANVGTAILPNPLAADYHSMWQQVRTGDHEPMFEANTDVPTSTANYIQSGYAEITASSTDGLQKMFRFLHNDNTASNPGFGLQNGIAGISMDGTFAALNTDVMGTRGSASPDWTASHAYALGDSIFPLTGNSQGVEFMATVAGTSGATQPNWATCTTTCVNGGVTWTNTGKTCNNLRALFSPAANTRFNIGDKILPVNSNTGSDIYEALTTGTTGATIPNWNTLAPSYGNTVMDGGVNWRNDGPNTCRGDIVFLDLLSAHPSNQFTSPQPATNLQILIQ